MSTSSSCGGSFVSGLCPGDSSIECCISSSSGSGGGGGSGSGSAVVSGRTEPDWRRICLWGWRGVLASQAGASIALALRSIQSARALAITIPRTAQEQYDATSQGSQVSTSDLQPGDLVFWGENGDCTSSVDHTAVYIGNNQIVAAPETGELVQTQTLWTSSDGLELCPRWYCAFGREVGMESNLTGLDIFQDLNCVENA